MKSYELIVQSSNCMSGVVLDEFSEDDYKVIQLVVESFNLANKKSKMVLYEIEPWKPDTNVFGRRKVVRNPVTGEIVGFDRNLFDHSED